VRVSEWTRAPLPGGGALVKGSNLTCRVLTPDLGFRVKGYKGTRVKCLIGETILGGRSPDAMESSKVIFSTK
jgi:hypothetical protein